MWDSQVFATTVLIFPLIITQSGFISIFNLRQSLVREIVRIKALALMWPTPI